MAKALNRLSARRVETLKEPGRHSDGGNLYFVVGPGDSRRWVFLYRWRGKQQEMGLGGFANVPLAKARELAARARASLSDDVNPLDAREAMRAVPTFGACADEMVSELSPEWKNAKHRAQWSSTLKNDAAALRPLPINQIGTTEILEVLKPIWTEKSVTASRLRGRIERVLDAAKARGFRTGENPARWRGHLDKLLPKRQKLKRGHHAALPFDDISSFMNDLRDRKATAALALEFLILTATRSGEVRLANWSEIDIDKKIWTIPAGRMKAGRQHRVPLSDQALKILEGAKILTGGSAAGFLFSGLKADSCLSDGAFARLLERMNGEALHVTAHGFRSTFRDWAGEVSTFPRELAEEALAHTVGDQTERAYRRGDALEKRRKLMQAWANFCDPKAAPNVIAISNKARVG